jgi:hypothetical protein
MQYKFDSFGLFTTYNMERKHYLIVSRKKHTPFYLLVDHPPPSPLVVIFYGGCRGVKGLGGDKIIDLLLEGVNRPVDQLWTRGAMRLLVFFKVVPESPGTTEIWNGRSRETTYLASFFGSPPASARTFASRLLNLFQNLASGYLMKTAR